MRRTMRVAQITLAALLCSSVYASALNMCALDSCTEHEQWGPAGAHVSPEDLAKVTLIERVRAVCSVLGVEVSGGVSPAAVQAAVNAIRSGDADGIQQYMQQ